MGTAAAHHFADHWEDAIATGIDPTSWAYAEDYTGEDEVVTGARASAADSGVAPIGPGAAALSRPSCAHDPDAPDHRW